MSVDVEQLSCRELVELVTDYLEGALSPEETGRFEEHIGRCTGCAAYLEQIRQTIALAGRLTPESLSPEAERQYVYVVTDDKVSRREVRIGGRRPGRVEILAGLTAGERVVVEGTQKVRDGATVRATERAVDPDPADGTAGKSHEANAGTATPASISQ